MVVGSNISGAPALKAIALRSLGYVGKNGKFWIAGDGAAKWAADGIIEFAPEDAEGWPGLK